MKTSSGTKLKKSSVMEDRISNLPDDVLCHILSFIPTIESIATCMLSTRWKHLWKHVPALNVHDSLPPFDYKENGNNVRFANFVTMFWTLHVSKGLEKLSLTCGNDDIYDVGKWVSDSITGNIQSLCLNIYYKGVSPVPLPSSLFTCKKLEVLVLRGLYHNISVNVPTVVCLPKLKTMELDGVKYQDDHIGNLISSCVSLESLLVKDDLTVTDYIGFRTISSSTLRDVEIRLCHPPSLIGYNPQIFCSALRRLNLSICGLQPFYSNPVRVPGNVFTCKTLGRLTLNGHFIVCASRTIRLPNLTFLALRGVEFTDDEILSRLVSSCTFLESLAVTKTMEAELKLSSSTLKVIDVKLSCKSNPGHKLVINAPALKRLKLMNVGYVDYQIEDVASLEQADVCISFYGPISSDYCSSVFTKAYQAVQHVKKLKIYQTDLDVGVLEHVLPLFNRLTDLNITIDGSMGYGFFKELIKNSIKLENLAIVLYPEASNDHYQMNDLNPVPACLLSSLRSVSIRCFEGREFELAVALYLLENSRIMEKMEVCFSQSYDIPEERRMELRNKILNVRRGSGTCDVVIIE